MAETNLKATIEQYVRNPKLREFFMILLETATGHDHDGSNSKAVTIGSIADGAVTLAKLSSAVQASLALADSALQSIVSAAGTAVNAVASNGTLTISDVVIDGETVTIDEDVYEFLADTAQSKTSPTNIAVDITSHTTKSNNTLTVDTQPTSGNTMTIGSKEYTFVPDGTANAEGEISIGTNLATAQSNIVDAVNGDDSHNTANSVASISAFSDNVATVTALVGGTAGDSIATEETFSAGTNIFSAGTLGSGADCSAANGATDLIAADEGSTYSMTSGGSGIVTVTAATKGVAGNSIATIENMANGAFASGTLGSGVDGTVGDQWDILVDTSYLYVAVGANTISDNNWRRISLGSVF